MGTDLQKDAPERPSGTPGVSVVITAYNYGRFLGEAIDSVLAQDYPLIETIVVDDGSTDNTAEVARSYDDKIRYIHRENGGPSAARNTGIEAVNHPFIMFLDADDTVLPNMISTLMQKFSDSSEQLGMVGCKFSYINEDGSPRPCNFRNDHVHGHITARDLLFRNRFATGAVIIRKSAFDSCGTFDTSMTCSEDRNMWLRIAAKFDVWLLRESLVLIRSHEQSLSRGADKMYRDMRVGIRKAVQGALAADLGVTSGFSALAFCDYQASWIYNAEGRLGSALFLLLKSVLRCPLFMNHRALECPFLFRVRAAGYMIRERLFGEREP